MEKPKLATNLLFKSLGEAFEKRMEYSTVGLHPKLWKEIVEENGNGNFMVDATTKLYPTVLRFVTPFGVFNLIIAMIPEDRVLFVDANGTPQGMIQLGGTPNIYRRIILD